MANLHTLNIHLGQLRSFLRNRIHWCSLETGQIHINIAQHLLSFLLTVCPATIFGKTDASAIRKFGIPCIRKMGSTTPLSSRGAIRAEQAGWNNVLIFCLTNCSSSASVFLERSCSKSGYRSPAWSIRDARGSFLTVASIRRSPLTSVLMSL